VPCRGPRGAHAAGIHTTAAEDIAVHAQTLADDIVDCVAVLPVHGPEEQERLARMAGPG
jgi:hypothetical protein